MSFVEWMERHQVALYFGALMAGGCVGILGPGLMSLWELLLGPALVVLMLVTFMAVPVSGLLTSLRDRRFLLTLLLTNFVLAPAVLALLLAVIPLDPRLLVPVVMVLLAPCIDYVVTFTGLAGGDSGRLVATTPLLMLAQVLLMPLYLRLFGGAQVSAAIPAGPFVLAFLVFILVPLGLAWLVQLASDSRSPGLKHSARKVLGAGSALMVPAMMLVLALVAAAHVTTVLSQAGSVMGAGLVFVLFAVVMLVLAVPVGRVARLDVKAIRTVAVSGMTRNSLVILPLVLTTGEPLAAPTVVSQTLVELLILLVVIRVLPRLIRQR